MRRFLFLALGIVEFVVALILLAFAWQLPGPNEVQDAVGRVQQVTVETSGQIGQLRGQLSGLGESQPRVRKLVVELRTQLGALTQTLAGQAIDFEAMLALNGSLGDVASGLDGLADTFKPETLGQFGGGLKTVADYLDGKLVPAASNAAAQLEHSTALLKADADRLAELARVAPPDLKAARQMHDGLTRLIEDLERVAPAERLKNLTALRDGLKGMDTALTSGADQVEKMASYSIPIFTMNGLKPKVEQRSMWPEGVRIAEGMRQAGRGAGAAAREMAALTDDLPRIQKALEESRKVALATRDALALALKNQDKLEPLLKDVPAHAARVAEALPKLGADLSRVLRDTGRLKEVADALRQADRGLKEATRTWPELRKTLTRSAGLLRDAQARLRPALDQKRYTDARKDTLIVIKSLSAALPLLTEQLEDDLHKQKGSLKRLGASIDRVTEVLPTVSSTASSILQTARLLLALVGLVFALHGGCVLLMEGRKTPPLPTPSASLSRSRETLS